MTCDEAHPLLSGLLDDELDARERAACEAHLAGCLDCARELTRLHATVSLVRGIGPARAPEGFAERVVSAARAENRRSWPFEAERRRGWPLRVSLSVAAAVVVAVIGVSVYRLTPELRDTVRYGSARERPPSTTSRQVTTPPPVATPPGAAAPSAARESMTALSRSQASPEPERGVREEPAPAGAARAPVPAHAAPPGGPPADGSRLPASRPAAMPFTVSERDQRAPVDATSPRREAVAKTARPDAARIAAGAPSASADRNVVAAPSETESRAAERPVEARLTVSTLSGVERRVVDVLTRYRGSLRGRVEEGETLTLTVDVSRDVYADFVRALAEIGHFIGPLEPPAATDPVQLVLHIAR